MSLWNSLWASERFPGGSGLWRGGLWTSQRAAVISDTEQLRQTLFGAGQQGSFYVSQPVVDGQQVLWQDAAGTVPVTADGQVVGRRDDLSGNGIHQTQSGASAKPLYRTDGTLHWLEYDTVDDRLTVSIRTFGVWDYCMGYRTDARDFVVAHRQPDQLQAWVGIGQSGNTSTDLDDSAGNQIAIYFDNVLSNATTRGGQYDLAQPAKTVIVNYDTISDTASHQKVTLGLYSGSITTPGPDHGFILREGTMSASERSDTHNYLASRAGA